MPHWLSAIICNAVCHLKRDLKKMTAYTNGKPNKLLAIKNKLQHLSFSK